MKVSVIIPVYNCGQYLQKSVEALLKQTYNDIEIILVNDGSTDDSKTIAEKYAATKDNVILINNETSLGAGPARNRGIAASTGEYLMFIDADDWLSPNAIEKLVCNIEMHNSDVAICGYETFIEGVGEQHNEIVSIPTRVMGTKEETLEFFATTFPEGLAGYLWNKLYRANIVKENSVTFPDMRRLQDGVFNVRYFDCVSSCVVISDALYHYRINAQVDMFRKCPVNYFDLIKSFSEYFIEAKVLWGDFSNEKIYTFFLNELGTCIENAYSPQWNMYSAERRNYFNRICNDSLFLAACKDVDDIGVYRKLLLKLLQLRLLFLFGVVVKTKVRVKISFKKAFYFVKGTVKNG